MKIKTFHAIARMRYTLDDEELLGALGETRQYALKRDGLLELAKEYSVGPGSSYTTEYHVGKGKIPVARQNYNASVRFDEAIELSKGNIDRELEVMKMLHLTFEYFTVEPADLLTFNDAWNYNDSWRRAEKAEKRVTTVRVKFMGRNPTESERHTLSSLADEAYFPEMRDDGLWWTATDQSSGGGDYPDTELVRKIEGDLTQETELEIVRFYDQVKKFVLDTRLIEDYRYDGPSSPTWSELLDHVKESHEPTLRELIESSTAGDPLKWYAPWLSIDHMIPSGEVRKGLVWGENGTELGDVRDVITVHNLPGGREPPIIVIGNYVWRT